jgi:hypothetical protein
MMRAKEGRICLRTALEIQGLLWQNTGSAVLGFQVVLAK